MPCVCRRLTFSAWAIDVGSTGAFFMPKIKLTMNDKKEIKTRLEIANERLRRYLDAEDAILKGQAYEMGDTKLTRANLKDVVSTINSLKKEIFALTSALNGRVRVRIVSPCW